MFQISGLGAVDTGGQHTRPDPYGTGNNPAPGGGSGTSPVLMRRYATFNNPPYRTWQAQATYLGPAQAATPPMFPPTGVPDPTPPPIVSDPVLTQNPTPGQTVVVGAQPGTPAYDDMLPWYKRYQIPLMILGGAAVLGLGYYLAKR